MSKRSIRRAMLCATASIGICKSVFAQTSTWTHVGDGTFNVTANWAGGVPGPSSTALFNLPSTYTVTFNANATNTALNFTASNVVFASTGGQRTYQLSSSATFSGGTFTLSGTTLSGPTVAGVPLFAVRTNEVGTINNAGDVITSVLSMGDISGTTELSIVGLGSTFTSTGAGDNVLGSTNDATILFSVQSNAFASFTGQLKLADNPNQTGNNKAIVNVLSGGSMVLGSLWVGSGSQLLLSGLANSGIFNVNGGSVSQTGAATVSISRNDAPNASTLSISNSGVFTSGTGMFYVGPSGTVTIDSGGVLNLNSTNVVIDGVLKRISGSVNLTSGHALQCRTPAWQPSTPA